jgi:hypothetical protein
MKKVYLTYPSPLGPQRRDVETLPCQASSDQ